MYIWLQKEMFLYMGWKKTFFHSLFFKKNKIFLHRDEEMHKSLWLLWFQKKGKPLKFLTFQSEPDVKLGGKKLMAQTHMK